MPTAGFGIVLVLLLIAASALYTDHKYILPFAAAGMLWGPLLVRLKLHDHFRPWAKPEYRGTASGFAYMFVKLPAFLAMSVIQPHAWAAVAGAPLQPVYWRTAFANRSPHC